MEYFLHKLHFLPEPAQLQNAVHADFVEEAAHVEHFRHEVYKLLPNAGKDRDELLAVTHWTGKKHVKCTQTVSSPCRTILISPHTLSPSRQPLSHFCLCLSFTL